MTRTRYHELLDRVLEGASLAPVTDRLGIRLLSWADGEAIMEMDTDESMHNAMGTVHGGTFVNLADAAFGCALATTLTDDETLSTLDIHASYFKPVVSGRLRATARLIRRGKRTAYLECEVVNSADELVAKLVSTCMVVQST